MKPDTVEIKLNYYDFERDLYMPTPVGRIHLGEHVARLFFDRVADKQIMVVSEAAIQDGSIHVIPECDTPLSGLGKLP